MLTLTAPTLCFLMIAAIYTAIEEILGDPRAAR